MKDDPNLWLEDIIEASDEISKYTNNVAQDEFVRDSMRYNATIRMISVIGDAITNLEKGFKEKYPQVPWQQIKDMRNILIHEYWQTDLDQVYLSATKEVPELRHLVQEILDRLTSSKS